MPDIEVISKTPLSLVELKEKLAEIKRRDKELSFRGKKTEEYLNSVVKTKYKKIQELSKEIENLDITRLKQKQVVKIIDVMPMDMDSLKVIFSSEDITLKQDDLTKILEIVKKYV